MLILLFLNVCTQFILYIEYSHPPSLTFEAKVRVKAINEVESKDVESKTEFKAAPFNAAMSSTIHYTFILKKTPLYRQPFIHHHMRRHCAKHRIAYGKTIHASSQPVGKKNLIIGKFVGQ